MNARGGGGDLSGPGKVLVRTLISIKAAASAKFTRIKNQESIIAAGLRITPRYQAILSLPRL